MSAVRRTLVPAAVFAREAAAYLARVEAGERITVVADTGSTITLSIGHDSRPVCGVPMPGHPRTRCAREPGHPLHEGIGGTSHRSRGGWNW